MVHRGAILYVVAVLQFVAAMAIVQVGFGGYSDVANPVSDLGNSSLSHWSIVFNVSIVLLGILGVAGTVLLRHAFPARRTSLIGIGALVLGFLGAVGVGLFPEGSPHGLHTIFSAVTSFMGGFGLLVLSFAMLRDTRWAGFRLYTLVSAIVTLGAFGALAADGSRLTDAGLFGGVERVVIAPLLLWAVVAGIHLLRIPSYSPEPAVTAWSG